MIIWAFRGLKESGGNFKSGCGLRTIISESGFRIVMSAKGFVRAGFQVVQERER